MIIESPPILQQGSIPVRHTCDGINISPPLNWRDIPAGTRSLALILDDPDAPDPAAPKTIWVHWILYNIPPDTSALREGSIPSGAKQGINDYHRSGYSGPCPPIGRHRYVFKLYALDIVLPDLNNPTKAVLVEAMQGHVLGSAQMIGLYQRQR